MRMLKRLLVIALVVAVIAIPINDGVRYLMAFYSVDDVTRGASEQAAGLVHSSGGDRNGPGLAAVNYARDRGVTVTNYDQQNGVVTVWTAAPVNGTIVYGAIVNATSGVPFRDWWKKAPLVKAKATAYSAL